MPAEEMITHGNIEIFEPGLCCGTGIYGVDVDQALVTSRCSTVTILTAPYIEPGSAACRSNHV